MTLDEVTSVTGLSPEQVLAVFRECEPVFRCESISGSGVYRCLLKPPNTLRRRAPTEWPADPIAMRVEPGNSMGVPSGHWGHLPRVPNSDLSPVEAYWAGRVERSTSPGQVEAAHYNAGKHIERRSIASSRAR
jgi:hypothetical protein